MRVSKESKRRRYMKPRNIRDITSHIVYYHRTNTVNAATGRALPPKRTYSSVALTTNRGNTGSPLVSKISS